MSKQRTYTGRSGQLAVMAELLFRQCNAAVPEVDWGTETRGTFYRRSSPSSLLEATNPAWAPLMPSDRLVVGHN